MSSRPRRPRRKPDPATEAAVAEIIESVIAGQLSREERQLLQILHEWGGKREYRLTIEFRDGAWEIALTAAPGGKSNTARGVGETFDQAWSNMAPTWRG
jgi:hypothetical protein